MGRESEWGGKVRGQETKGREGKRGERSPYSLRSLWLRGKRVTKRPKHSFTLASVHSSATPRGKGTGKKIKANRTRSYKLPGLLTHVSRSLFENWVVVK